jgi:hypothetical protein
MPDLEIRTAASTPGGRRSLWLRVLGLVVLGGVLLLVISLPGFANENQQQPGLGVYVVMALVLAGVISRTYVVVRRSGVAKRRAMLVSAAVVPGSYCAAVLFFVLIVYLFSS